MNKFLFSTIISLSMVFTACKDQRIEEGPVSDFNLTFKALYDGAQLEKAKEYPYNTSNYPLVFTLFRTYISDITLVSANKEVKLKDVIDVNFFPTFASTNVSATPTFTFKGIPEGNYTAIKFGLGVSPEMNAKSPNAFPADNVLSSEIEYWQGWASYIFTKIEAVGDANNNNAPDHWMIYHTGSDPVYRTITLTQPITVGANSPAGIISFDLKKLFVNPDGTPYDMEASPATSSSLTDLRVAEFIVNAFVQATTFKQ
jgi:hypothetical protein